MSRTRVLRIASAALVALSLSSCGSDPSQPAGGPGTTGGADQPSTSASQPAATCAPSNDRMIDIARRDGEPRVQLPQPAGWEPNAAMTVGVIKLVLSNAEASSESFAPTVVVTVESMQGGTERALDAEVNGLKRAGATDIQASPSSVCGHPARTVRFTLPQQAPLPARLGVSTVVAVPVGSTVFAYTLVAQWAGSAPDAARKDIETIARGLHITV